ncbi:hypothetical protein [Sphingomonas sp. Leaf10]|uniref:hypothetical protein n=1 Tax=Sphingomonas sp. Leaf10 TaxID=1735676 RepID=UPI0006F86789|nr:hypothetical protein [Sphingomonas sp. Leaf10]KQM38085.1 hypothetical protein ASE59_12410 [Sphingomonas sp. Leaf10]
MIASITNDQVTANPTRSSSRVAGTRFCDVFQSAAVDKTGLAAGLPGRHEPQIAAAGDAESARLNEAVAAFKKEISMTPAERVRRDVLKSMDLTEEAIKELSPKDRVEVEQKVAIEVARRMKIMDGRSASPVASISG